MPYILQSLEREKEQYEKARNALINANSFVENITGSLASSIGFIEEGIEIGGTGLQLYRLSEMEGYVGYLKTNLSSAISFCAEEITRLKNEISARKSYLSSQYSFKGSSSVNPTGSKNYGPVQALKE